MYAEIEKCNFNLLVKNIFYQIENSNFMFYLQKKPIKIRLKTIKCVNGLPYNIEILFRIVELRKLFIVFFFYLIHQSLLSYVRKTK